jgi:hypothetical protein
VIGFFESKGKKAVTFLKKSNQKTSISPGFLAAKVWPLKKRGK